MSRRGKPIKTLGKYWLEIVELPGEAGGGKNG